MSGKILKGVVGALMIVAGSIIPGLQPLIFAGMSMISSAVLQPKAPKISPNATDRLNATMVPDTPRKIVFGHTAMATDVRYQGYTGSDQEYVHWIMASAAHECESAADELWFDSKKAWSATGGVTSDYNGYLTVEVRNPGASGNGITIDGVWTSSATLTGCAYLHVRFKTTGNDKKAESPFANSLPSRVTVRGKGALLPDLRESGCEADDQSTWDWFSDDSGRNPALQLLFYLIGWRINDKLSVGRGLPVDRLDLDSFITAANFCDEPVSLAAGGTEPRYRSDGVFSEGDDPALVIGNLCSAMNAVMRDVGGRLSIHCLHNTLSVPVAAFDETDILGDEEWVQTPAVDDYFNLVRGRYTDPSDASLYQLVDYPEIEVDSPDGIERADQFDLACVQSASQAQRLAKQRLQRNLYRGIFTAKFNERAWQVNLGDVITLSHLSLGWDEKLFRVTGHGISLDGITTMSLQEEHEDIYAWEEEESPAVVAATPTAYDALNSPLIKAIGELDALGIAAYLTNISHTVPATSTGTVTSYTGAAGAFVVMHGTDDISDQFTLSTKSGGNPQSLTVTYDNGVDPRTYSVTGAGTSSGDFGHSGTNVATLTIRATGSGDYTGVTIDLVFSLVKSKAGTDGSPAKLLTISQDRPLISYDAAGALDPSSQTTTFTANKQNTVGTVAWTLTDTLGNVLTPGTYLSGTTGDSITMTAANFSAAIAVNGAQGVIVTGTIAADSLSDKVGLLRIQKGATGANAKNVDVSSDRDAFTFDGGGNLNPGTQSAVVTANPQNLTGGNVVWSYADNLGTASATLAGLVTATSTNVRTVPSTVFTGTPTRLWLRVVATGQGAEAALSDATTIHRLQDGASVLTMLLSNESHNVPTDSAGASGDFSGAIGQIKVFWGTADVTASATLSEVSETGCTGDVNTALNTPFTGAKGAYRVTAMSADTGLYKMRAVYNPGSGNVTVDRDFTLAKSKTGLPGTNNALVFLYQRGASAPALPSGSPATYTFATGAVTGGTLNGWTTAIPAANGDPLWVTAQQASSTTSTASLTAAGWAAAVQKDGAGVNNRVVTLYQRTATNSAPSVPAGTLTYTFSTGGLSGTLGSWSTTPPALTSGAYLFATFAVALGTGATDTIPTGEWSTPTPLSTQDWAAVTGSTRPADNAGTTVNLTSIGSTALTIRGNSIQRNSGAGDRLSQVRGDPLSGPQFCEMDILQVSDFTIISLDDDATTFAAATMLFEFFYNYGSGAWNIATNGSGVGSGTTTAGLVGKMRITYDGVRFRFWINQTQLGPDVAASGTALTLWPKWAAYGSSLYTGLRQGTYYADAVVSQVTIQKPSDPTIQLTVAGAAVTGQLPRPVSAPGVTRLGSTITTANNVSYAIQNITGGLGTVTIDNTNGSGTKGQSTIPSAGFTGAGSYEIVITVDGVALQPIKITVGTSGAYVPPTGGSNKSGGFTVSDTIALTSYVQVGGTIAGLVKAAGETIRCYYSGTYTYYGSSGTRTASLKWQYSPAGAGTWTDLAAGVTGSIATANGNSDGSVTCNQTVAPANASYDVRLVAAVSVAGSVSFNGQDASVLVGV